MTGFFFYPINGSDYHFGLDSLTEFFRSLFFFFLINHATHFVTIWRDLSTAPLLGIGMIFAIAKYMPVTISLHCIIFVTENKNIVGMIFAIAKIMPVTFCYNSPKISEKSLIAGMKIAIAKYVPVTILYILLQFFTFYYNSLQNCLKIAKNWHDFCPSKIMPVTFCYNSLQIKNRASYILLQFFTKISCYNLARNDLYFLCPACYTNRGRRFCEFTPSPEC